MDKNIFLKQIGLRIRKARSEAKLSQAELGEPLGVQGAAISKYESGEADAGAYGLSIIADTCKVSLDWLITGKEHTVWPDKTWHAQVNESDSGYLPPSSLDLMEVVVSVDEYLIENDIQLPPRKKADLCIILVEMMKGGGQVDKGTIAKFAKLAT